jgi:hypothetical protein
MGEMEGVKFNEKQFAISKGEILKVLKAQVASNIFSFAESFQIFNEGDVVIAKALKVLADEKEYNRLLGYQ